MTISIINTFFKKSAAVCCAILNILKEIGPTIEQYC